MATITTRLPQRSVVFSSSHRSSLSIRRALVLRDGEVSRRGNLETFGRLTAAETECWEMIRFILVQNRQGKTRLSKWYVPYDDDEKVRLRGEVHRVIAARDQKHQSNFVEFRNYKIVYRRYAGPFFCICIDANDNELTYLEAIHLFVEVLDAFFENVCELDLVFNFHKERCGIDSS